jgi:RNA polymerase sigma-70 factor (ECF subfamily)
MPGPLAGGGADIGAAYERHAADVHRFLARRVGDAADDLLGDVFVVALRQRHGVHAHESGSLLPWLYGIAGNVVRNHLRRASAVPADDLDAADAVDWAAVDARLDAVGRRHELRAALSALSAADQQLLLLVAWEGLTPAEAGAALGLTPTAARSRLHRARATAQAHLDQLERTP